MDNSSQWTIPTGTWLVSSGSNPYGGGSLYSNESGAIYEYCASGVSGDKDVSLWWTEYSNRCTSVQVDIYDGSTLIDTKYVNQQANGGQWNSLGTWRFTGTARVVINSQGGCTTSADAVWIGGSAPPTCPSLPSDGIMDNASQWTSLTGMWQTSSGANYYGTQSYYSNEVGATYEYCASGVSGDKDVSLWWTEWSNRCTVVQVDIYDGSTNIGTAFVNQQAGGGKWNSLGTWRFTGTARVVINSQGGCTTSADACKIGGSPPPPCPSLPTDGIMDNGTQWTSSTGTWQPSSGANPYGGGSLYSNEAGATYEYCASGVSGDKDVSLWWTEWSNRCTDVQVDIYDGSTNIGTAFVNQQVNARRWNSLGTYSFTGEARVVINSQGGCTTCADACMIGGTPEPCPTLPADGIMDNGSQWTTATGNWLPSGGANPYGGSSLYSNTIGSYEYCATGVSGSKPVSLWWTEWSNRCTNVPVDIYDGNTLLDTKYVNQQANGGRWINLGVFAFSDPPRVVINSQGGCTTSVDAVRIHWAGSVIDNGDTGSAFTGSWLNSSGANPYGGGSLYSNESGATYEFSASVIPNWPYTSPQMHWTEWSNRCTNVQVDIYDGNTLLVTRYVNQQVNGGQWNDLDIISAFTSYDSGTLRVVITSQDGCTTCADAVRIFPEFQ